MITVTNAAFCKRLYSLGALGVLHRAEEDDKLCKTVAEVRKDCEWVAASIGVGEDQRDLAKKLISAGANILFVDIAHGYSENVIDIGRWLKKNYPNVKVVVGNATNISFIYECANFADAIKVGLANGLACETALTAGCTEGQFTTVYKFREISKELGIPVISDGGIRKPADFVKALGAGAASVMAGSIFARCPESAAPNIKDASGKDKKLYAGMASRYVQDMWRGGLKSGTCPEGRVVLLDLGEPVDSLLERYSGALRSAITYAGVNNLADFRLKTKFGRRL
jgi:IMP dehydrogenase